MKYMHSTLFQMYKRAAQRAELQWQALAEDVQRERQRGRWGTKAAPVVIVKRRVVRKEAA